MVSVGKSVYLSLPGTASLVPGHCLIVPMGHVTAGTYLDEDVWNEIQEYRKALTKMFMSRNTLKILPSLYLQLLLLLLQWKRRKKKQRRWNPKRNLKMMTWALVCSIKLETQIKKIFIW